VIERTRFKKQSFVVIPAERSKTGIQKDWLLAWIPTSAVPHLHT